jgi:hypothetical protein
MDCKKLHLTTTDGQTVVINREEVTLSRRSLGLHDAPAGGNKGHLEFIKDNTSQWINRMKNGHLPCHTAWVAYQHQLWAGLRYRLGTMTNNIEEAEYLLMNKDHKILNVLGIARSVPKRLRRLQPTYGGCGLFNLATEQLISRMNMLLQHYHTPTITFPGLASVATWNLKP